MKKLLTLSPSKIFVACALGLFVTVGAFWQHQSNQSQLDRLSVLGQGVGTCFTRISQTFTAMMIKEINSPYLNRGFMSLSDECLGETVKGINPFKRNVGKGFEFLNQLVSEVHWFHEKVLKLHSPMVVGQKLNEPLGPVSERFGKMENLKLNLIDEIDATSVRLREVQVNSQMFMGLGLLIFVLSLSVLSLQEFNRLQLRREIEMEAMGHLKSGKLSVGAIVDKLVDRALSTQGLPATAQIFRDYHGEILEGMSVKLHSPKAAPEHPKREVSEAAETPAIPEEAQEIPRASLKEVLVSILNVQPKNSLQLSDVRDVTLAVETESLEMLINAAVNKLVSCRTEGKRVMVSNQIHSDRSVINCFLAGATFTAGELEFFSGDGKAVGDELDMNLVLLREMVTESGIQWNIENKIDRLGKISGMNIRFVVKRAPRDNRSKLVSVIRGKKKDLTREMMN